MHHFDLEEEINRNFSRTERTIKRFGCVTIIMMLPAILLYGAIALALLYFLGYAITHWLRW